MSVTRVRLDNGWLSHLDAPIARHLEDIGQKVEDAAKRVVPVESGDLRDSITHDVEGGVLSVTAGDDKVDYAGYVEVGTRHMPAQPYLRPALTSVGATLR